MPWWVVWPILFIVMGHIGNMYCKNKEGNYDLGMISLGFISLFLGYLIAIVICICKFFMT
jgi:hypothetical protein